MNNIMGKILTEDLASQYSLLGRKGKNCFKVYGNVTDTVLGKSKKSF
jgi:hypothetical protein